ncbi:hypothetical protein WICMUC_003729 [Wickerhamomyces mucosus]|uniref:DUF654-domain-containing protein n=1 Tax=Wickerhamomyces mucosus TaxID=1378264 RepID=A0A9P8PKL7_9ASCO|nr:hypothetical protein WICMUC_003729 [Wickerhamomyces mucosus]
MSSRALRRLEREREKSLEHSASDDEQLSNYQPVNKAKNLFALIGDDEENEEEEEEEGEEEGEEDQIQYQNEENDSKNSAAIPYKEIPKVQIATKSQKKNKKKKNNKKKTQTEEEENIKDDFEDNLNQILKELNEKEGIPEGKTIDLTEDSTFEENELELNITHPTIDPSYRFFTIKKQIKSANLLKIDVKDLDPDNEFKKLFGKLSAEAIEDADSTTSTSIPPEQLAQIKKLSKIIRGWGGRDRRSIPGTSRKLILTKIRDDWIPTQKKDMTMEELTIKELIEDKLEESEDWIDVVKEDVATALKNGIKFYKFERGPESKLPNSQFYSSVVVNPNHESLIQLLQRFPYHPETILQVALIFIRQGDKSNSNGLIERSLFAFDRAFKQNFDLSNGLTRLPYNYYLNRQFYLTIFRYIEVLTKKGTYATALTYSKLLLALDPAKDPLGARYFIDFYAIISADYKYLIDLVESPLVTTYSKWYTPGLAYSTALAYFRLGNLTKSKENLKKAFIKHPYVGYKLLEAIGLASDIPVSDYSIFEVGPEIEISTEAYLLRAPIIWSDSKERKFLHDTLLEILKSDNKLKFQQDKDGIIPKNFLRFAILSGEGKLMAKIPQELWDQIEVFEYDVLPPIEGNVEHLSDFIDNRLLNQEIDDERLMEMVRNMSLQEIIDSGIQVAADD